MNLHTIIQHSYCNNHGFVTYFTASTHTIVIRIDTIPYLG